MAHTWPFTPTDGFVHVSVAIATQNYAADTSDGWVPFVFPFPEEFHSLVQKALDMWAFPTSNLRFDWVPDEAPDRSASSPDIRIGIADLKQFPPLATMAGDARVAWDDTGHLTQSHVVVENPGETAVTKLDQENGDYEYNGFTVLQVLVHEIGHALGLEYPNPADPSHSTDPTSIMYPELSHSNYHLDDSDVAAANALYPFGLHAGLLGVQSFWLNFDDDPTAPFM